MQAGKNRFCLSLARQPFSSLWESLLKCCVENSKSSASSKASIWCTSPGGTSMHCPASIFKFFDYLVARHSFDPNSEATRAEKKRLSLQLMIV
jgi:hypothetical protein